MKTSQSFAQSSTIHRLQTRAEVISMWRLFSEDSSIKLPSSITCVAKDVIAKFAHLIRSLEKLEGKGSQKYTSQFYVWSSSEQALLQSHIINAALTSSADDVDIQLCIGALAQGVDLLQTTFQPLLLSGALLSFLGQGRMTIAEYKMCLQRMGLSTDGTVETLRKRIDSEVRKIQGEGSCPGQEEQRKEFGELPRVVPLQREIGRQLALPMPGYWDLPECVASLLQDAEDMCPNDEQIFTAYKSWDNTKLVDDLLLRRNRLMYAVLKELRVRAVSSAGHSLFVNEAKSLSIKFIDICHEPHIRKLFFMQQVRQYFEIYSFGSSIDTPIQFEVLTKLNALWQSRIDACPEAPTLEFCTMVKGQNGPEYIFRLISGAIDVPSTDRDYSFYDKLLVLDIDNEEGSDNLSS
jgi:hypothetical protein